MKKYKDINILFPIALLFLIILIPGCIKDPVVSNGNPVGPPIGPFTEIGGNIGNATLTLANSPYKVTSDIIVDSSLNMEPGIKIYFSTSTGLYVKGKLNCVGNVTQRILLTSLDTSWKGIKISNTNDQSVIKFANIENVDLVSPFDSSRNSAVEISNASAVITNNIFNNNKSINGGALYLNNSQSMITNNIFSNNYCSVSGGAITSEMSSNSIINNTFYGNSSTNYAGALYLLDPVLDNVQNNIFYLNVCGSGDSRVAIFGADSTHYIVQYNYLVLNSGSPFMPNTEFHLSSNSPCIDTGNPDTQYNDTNGTRNDQGAYGGPLGDW